MQYKILVINDHPIMLAGYRRILEDDPARLVLEARSGKAALRVNEEHLPQVAIVDMHLLDMDSLELLGSLLMTNPSLKILSLSQGDDTSLVSRSLSAGALGCITKRDEPEVMIQALHAIQKGEVYLGRSLAVKMAMIQIRPNGDPLQGLSPRELDILDYLSKGHNLTDIAHKLDIGYRTVASLAASIRRRLNIPNLYALVKFAVDHAPIKRR